MAVAKANRQDVSDLQAHTGFWMRAVSNHVSHTFALRLLESGVTVAEWVVLRTMYDSQSMAPSALAEAIGMTRGAASKLVDRLVVKKLVLREGRDDDRRRQEVSLTAAGRKIVPSLAVIADENDRQFFAPLTQHEHEALRTILKKLVHAHGLHKIPTE